MASMLVCMIGKFDAWSERETISQAQLRLHTWKMGRQEAVGFKPGELEHITVTCGIREQATPGVNNRENAWAWLPAQEHDSQHQDVTLGEERAQSKIQKQRRGQAGGYGFKPVKTPFPLSQAWQRVPQISVHDRNVQKAFCFPMSCGHSGCPQRCFDTVAGDPSTTAPMSESACFAVWSLIEICLVRWHVIKLCQVPDVCHRCGTLDMTSQLCK